jgi:ActR/RegA family two-component response regulator
MLGGRVRQMVERPAQGIGGDGVPRDEQLKQALERLGDAPGRAVLIVEPSPDHQARLARLMAVHGHRAIGTSTLDGARAFLQAFPVDLVLLAEEVTADAPLQVVAEMIGRRPNARIVIMTPKDAETAESRRFAALEYVPRSFGVDVLQTLLLE